MPPAKTSAISRVRDQRRADLEAMRPDTRTAILDAAERLLSSSPLHEIAVAQILDEANVSRGSFYSYFESKYEVAGALLGRVMEEMYEVWRPYVEREDDADPEEMLRSVLWNALVLWRDNHAIGRVMHQYWDSVPEIGEQWLASMERFTAAVAAELDRDRKAGIAPPGADSRRLAAAALWSTEQLMFVSGTGRSGDLADQETTYETALTLWDGLLYGGRQNRGEK